MTRINITQHVDTDQYTDQYGDQYGERVLVGWFDQDKATTYTEATYWDGSNNISVVTGSQWHHERLHHTASGRWVRHAWSQWQGSRDTHTYISADRARDWLLLNEHDDTVAALFGPVEHERGPGRPEVGGAVHVRLGELLAPLDRWAEEHEVSRAEAMRRLVERGLVPECG